ncbi:MAG: SpoIID/LytB domain-containing protein [Actinomycetota bacterium]
MRLAYSKNSPRVGRRLGAAGLGLLLSLALLLPAAPEAAAEVTFTFQGGGYGHSVGMSQYGAYGMAREGYTWQQILSHYFTGASPGAADPGLLAAPLWVGLTQERTRIELTVVTTGTAAPAPATFTQGTETISAVGGEKVVVEQLGNGTCRVSGPGGTSEGPCTIDVVWDGSGEQPTTALELGDCTLPDWNAPGGTVWRPCRYARGSLHIRPDNNVGFDVSLEIGVEAYLLGISESPYAWGTMGAQAALEAQVVAARSYALHRAIDRGDPASRNWCWCHVYDTTADQFYVGYGHSTRPWLDAVAATAGQVMLHPSETRNGVLIPIETFYSSSTFGWTEDSENGFTAYVPYLRAVDDHWSRLASTGNPNARWTRTFSAGDLAARLPGMSTITGATVTRCSATGAALEITFTGQGGPSTFTTRDLRGRLALRSMQVYNVGAPPPETPPCSGPGVAPIDPGGPVVLAGLTLDDDAAGDSRGNGDGVAWCGETVEAFTTITNQGLALTGVAATLTSADPYVTILWNTSSGYPDLAAGASAVNAADWDLALAAETPPAYTAHLDLQVTAVNGGPWDLDVALPVSCAAPLEGVLAAPGDVDGDGTGEVAVAYARDGLAPVLNTYSGASGQVLATVTLAPAGYTPIDAVSVPSFTGSPADEVAVLLTAPGRPARVVVVDTARGKRLTSFGLSRAATYLEIEALPAADGASPTLAILTQSADGAVRALRRDAATGARLGRVGFGRTIVPAALAVLPGDGGGSRLVLVGNNAAGALVAVARRTADGHLAARLRLSPSLVPRDAAAVGPGGDPLLVIVATDPANGTVRLISLAPVTGARAATFLLANLTEALRLAPLTDAGGGPATHVAVLGTATDGAQVATVADPLTGTLLAAPEFPDGYLTDDLVALGPGGALAALGRATGDRSVLTLRHAVTGAPLASYPIP